MRRIFRYFFIALIALFVFAFVNNNNLFVSPSIGKPTLLAHRGISQRFDTRDLKADTCTASRMLPTNHGFMENTIPSMEASFAAGADIVELDVHPTTDGQFAVFHDWTLDCRTNGTGVTRDHSMAELKKLDVAFGYTADGGKTYPLRGQGIGKMPTLEEVLIRFPERRFLINVKSRDLDEGRKLASFLTGLSNLQRSKLIVIGGSGRVIEMVHSLQPDLRVISKQTLKNCLLPYIGYGWTGAMPAACEKTVILVPINVAPWLWGWPDRFLSRFSKIDTEVFILGPYSGGEFSNGIDSIDELETLPEGFSGGIWTNEIEAIASNIHRIGQKN